MGTTTIGAFDDCTGVLLGSWVGTVTATGFGTGKDTGVGTGTVTGVGPLGTLLTQPVTFARHT